MISIYFSEKNSFIKAKKSLDISVKNVSSKVLLKFIKKNVLSSKKLLLSKKMCQISKIASLVKSLQKSWIAKDFGILSDIYIVSSKKNNNQYVDKYSVFSHIRWSKDFILSYQSNIHKLMNFISQTLSYRIDVPISNGNRIRKNIPSFSNLVLSHESESLAAPNDVDEHQTSSSKPENESDTYTSQKSFPEEVTPSFVKTQGEIQWRDSAGNLHALPIE